MNNKRITETKPTGQKKYKRITRPTTQAPAPAKEPEREDPFTRLRRRLDDDNKRQG